MYAELSSTAKEDNPQPAVEQFLALHTALSRASLVTDSLSKDKLQALATAVTAASPDQPNDQIPEEALKLSADKRRRATSWVNAALATDLSPFSLYNHKPSSAVASSVTSPITVVLEGPPRTSSASTTSAGAAPAKAALHKSRLSTALAAVKGKGRAALAAAPPPPPPEWERGGGLDEGLELSRMLKEDANIWFLGFVERFLDADAAAAPPDREQVAGMLSQLKKVNDWLEVIGEKRRSDGGDEGEAESEEGSEASTGIRVPPETIERLRKKIYEYLLVHVESAAVALGGVGAAPLSANGGERQGSRKA